MIVSTGMCTLEEIDRTYEVLVATGIPFALLNCVSEYPPRYEDINLDVITVMKERYPRAVIGHSDHTPDLYTSFAAVVLGAKIIEKHVILDKALQGPDRAVSINFEELRELVEGIRKIEAARGSERTVHAKEVPIRTWAFRYVVAEKGLHTGEVITVDRLRSGDVWTKRTGRPDGIRAHDLPRLVGAKVLRDIPPNSPLFWADLEPPRTVSLVQ
jgi:N-acetylneuraminate synthase